MSKAIDDIYRMFDISQVVLNLKIERISDAYTCFTNTMEN